ncbi:RICIN domain-containing protein [Lentzea albidocapillata]|nr:RICIN domain-containing protein [Lentzea albidocapillata]
MKNVIRRFSVAIAAGAALMSIVTAPASAAPKFEPYDLPGVGTQAQSRIGAASEAVWTAIIPKTTDVNYGSTVDRCADIAWNSVDNGARAILFDCYGTNNQKWAPVWVAGTGTQYGTAMFINANSGKCLDLSGSAPVNGSHVIQWSCHNDTNQQWEVVLPAGVDPETYNGPIMFKNRATGKCLDTDHGGIVNGTGFLQWDCHGEANQLFSLYKWI